MSSITNNNPDNEAVQRTSLSTSPHRTLPPPMDSPRPQLAAFGVTSTTNKTMTSSSSPVHPQPPNFMSFANHRNSSTISNGLSCSYRSSFDTTQLLQTFIASTQLNRRGSGGMGGGGGAAGGLQSTTPLDTFLLQACMGVLEKLQEANASSSSSSSGTSSRFPQNSQNNKGVVVDDNHNNSCQSSARGSSASRLLRSEEEEDASVLAQDVSPPLGSIVNSAITSPLASTSPTTSTLLPSVTATTTNHIINGFNQNGLVPEEVRCSTAVPLNTSTSDSGGSTNSRARGIPVFPRNISEDGGDGGGDGGGGGDLGTNGGVPVLKRRATPSSNALTMCSNLCKSMVQDFEETYPGLLSPFAELVGNGDVFGLIHTALAASCAAAQLQQRMASVDVSYHQNHRGSLSQTLPMGGDQASRLSVISTTTTTPITPSSLSPPSNHPQPIQQQQQQHPHDGLSNFTPRVSNSNNNGLLLATQPSMYDTAASSGGNLRNTVASNNPNHHHTTTTTTSRGTVHSNYGSSSALGNTARSGNGSPGRSGGGGGAPVGFLSIAEDDGWGEGSLGRNSHYQPPGASTSASPSNAVHHNHSSSIKSFFFNSVADAKRSRNHSSTGGIHQQQGLGSTHQHPGQLSPTSSIASMSRGPIRQTNEVRQHVGDDGFTMINQYMVLDELGKGSFGSVKLGFDTVEDRLVAIKILQRDSTLWKRLANEREEQEAKRQATQRTSTTTLSTTDDSHNTSASSMEFGDWGARLRRVSVMEQQRQMVAVEQEIDVMKRVRHPNLVALFEVIDDPDEDKLYLVMQYVDDGVLASVPDPDDLIDIKSHPQLATAQGFLGACKQICTGLEYLHTHRIVHRDLKPENILVGKDGTLCIADFGVSSSLADAPSDGAMGTKLFMAPELLNGHSPTKEDKHKKKPVTGLGLECATDMWALGVTIYFLLYCKLPFSTLAEAKAGIVSYPSTGDTWWLQEVSIGETVLSQNVCGRRNSQALRKEAGNKPLISMQERAAREHLLPAMEKLLRRMLDIDPSKRITANAAKVRIKRLMRDIEDVMDDAIFCGASTSRKPSIQPDVPEVPEAGGGDGGDDDDDDTPVTSPLHIGMNHPVALLVGATATKPPHQYTPPTSSTTPVDQCIVQHTIITTPPAEDNEDEEDDSDGSNGFVNRKRMIIDAFRDGLPTSPPQASTTVVTNKKLQLPSLTVVPNASGAPPPPTNNNFAIDARRRSSGLASISTCATSPIGQIVPALRFTFRRGVVSEVYQHRQNSAVNEGKTSPRLFEALGTSFSEGAIGGGVGSAEPSSRRDSNHQRHQHQHRMATSGGGGDDNSSVMTPSPRNVTAGGMGAFGGSTSRSMVGAGMSQTGDSMLGKLTAALASAGRVESLQYVQEKHMQEFQHHLASQRRVSGGNANGGGGGLHTYRTQWGDIGSGSNLPHPSSINDESHTSNPLPPSQGVSPSNKGVRATTAAAANHAPPTSQHKRFSEGSLFAEDRGINNASIQSPIDAQPPIGAAVVGSGSDWAEDNENDYQKFMAQQRYLQRSIRRVSMQSGQPILSSANLPQPISSPQPQTSNTTNTTTTNGALVSRTSTTGVGAVNGYLSMVSSSPINASSDTPHHHLNNGDDDDSTDDDLDNTGVYTAEVMASMRRGSTVSGGSPNTIRAVNSAANFTSQQKQQAMPRRRSEHHRTMGTPEPPPRGGGGGGGDHRPQWAITDANGSLSTSTGMVMRGPGGVGGGGGSTSSPITSPVFVLAQYRNSSPLANATMIAGGGGTGLVMNASSTSTTTLSGASASIAAAIANGSSTGDGGGIVPILGLSPNNNYNTSTTVNNSSKNDSSSTDASSGRKVRGLKLVTPTTTSTPGGGPALSRPPSFKSSISRHASSLSAGCNSSSACLSPILECAFSPPLEVPAMKTSNNPIHRFESSGNNNGNGDVSSNTNNGTGNGVSGSVVVNGATTSSTSPTAILGNGKQQHDQGHESGENSDDDFNGNNIYSSAALPVIVTDPSTTSASTASNIMLQMGSTMAASTAASMTHNLPSSTAQGFFNITPTILSPTSQGKFITTNTTPPHTTTTSGSSSSNTPLLHRQSSSPATPSPPSVLPTGELSSSIRGSTSGGHRRMI